MSEQHALLADTADKVFAGLSGDFAADWRAVEDAGLAAVMVPETRGGFGGGFEDAHIILHAAGRHAAPLPMAEAVIAARILAESGLATDGALTGSLTLAKDAEGRLEHGRFTGTLTGVACGGDCARAVAIIEGQVVSLACGDAEVIERHSDPTDTPYLTLRFAGAPADAARSEWTAHRLFHAMALARASQIGGAITAALELAATHVNQREQFGRPLAKFQAIQQQMAVLAEEEAAANAAAHAAARAADEGEADFPIACAKLRANRAAGEAASIAHQVHGAIGFTREYDLQRFTRRLWAWRGEYGNERHWANLLGGQAARQGADGFWPALVTNFAN